MLRTHRFERTGTNRVAVQIGRRNAEVSLSWGARRTRDEVFQAHITCLVCDWWHGYAHCDDCPTNPWMIETLCHRIHDVNTSIAEQVFSWFRRFASTLNELRPRRHRFICLFYAAMHNDVLGRGEATYINWDSYVHKPPKAVGGHYGCAPEPKKKADKKDQKKSTTKKWVPKWKDPHPGMKIDL